MKLLVTGAWNCTEEQLNSLRLEGHEVVFMQYEKDLCPVNYSEVEGVICNGLFLHHPIEKFTSLKFIQLTSAGFDRVDLNYIKSNGIEIYNAKGVYSVPMAEYALWGALQFSKKGKSLQKSQSEHKWEKARDAFELFGKKICIIGCGDIGTECAKRFWAMGCKVCGVDLYPSENEYYSVIYSLGDLLTAVSDADYVALTLPLTSDSKHLIDKNVLNAMKDSAVLINISRGAVVRTEHLLEALAEKKIGGAVLDVFEEEPLDENSPLWDMENVIITPHSSFVSDGNGHRLYQVIMGNIG